MRCTCRNRTSDVGKWLCLSASVLLASPVSGQTQPGLLQEWVRAANPGNRDGLLNIMETEELLVPPFHSSLGTSWWTGSQNPGWNAPQYPAEVIDALDNPGDNESYVVRATGEIYIPESGTYRFADGNDDYTYWAVDVDRSGVAGDDLDEVLIDDNEWTNLQRTENNGGGGLGEIDVDVPAGGEWLAVEYLMGEAVGTDASVIYWDYGVDGGGLNAAVGFPELPEDAVGLAEAENYLIPDSHLRAPAGPLPSGPGHYVAGLGRIGQNSLQGGIANEVVSGGGEPQAGLLQEWVRQNNPGNRDALVDLVENEELIVPAFHSSDGTSWWTGSQSPGWLVPKYPSEVIDQLDNPNDNNGYVVRLTGELFIPESGTYVFADGNDDYTYWAVDADRSGVAGDDRTEVLINDNAWTNLQRSTNSGGSGYGEVEINVSPGGDWIAVEFLLGESVGTDAGVIYWDYDADGGGLNAAEGFPQARDEAADLYNAEGWLIPDTHLRLRRGRSGKGGSHQPAGPQHPLRV